MLVHKLLVDLAPPFVTAKSWSIMDGRTGEILFGKCENDRREIASMTKIMTLFVVIQIIRKIKLNAEKTMLQVSKNAATVGGTSAKLKTGDVLSIWDLCHGLMLPSGNDAGICLAEHFGQYLYEVATRYKNNKNANNGQPTNASNPASNAPLEN
jgi:D-alanyl-D-alanine carboxypeptidase